MFHLSLFASRQRKNLAPIRRFCPGAGTIDFIVVLSREFPD